MIQIFASPPLAHLAIFRGPRQVAAKTYDQRPDGQTIHCSVPLLATVEKGGRIPADYIAKLFGELAEVTKPLLVNYPFTPF
ncbi:MAG: hypothetical protein ACXV5H_04410 [Halobacteriota archaeon]